VDTLIAYHSGGVAWYDADQPAAWGIADRDFGAGGAWALLGDSVIATVDGYAGRIRWFGVGPDGLNLLGERRVDVASREIPAAEARAIQREIRERLARQGRTARVELLLPPRRSGAIAAQFGEDGTLWVRLLSADAAPQARHWIGVRRTDTPVERLALPLDFTLHFVRGDLFYGGGRTEWGSPVVRVYRVERAGGSGGSIREEP
jgi:hypothetical protein